MKNQKDIYTYHNARKMQITRSFINSDTENLSKQLQKGKARSLLMKDFNPNISKLIVPELTSAVGVVFNNEGQVLLGKSTADDDRKGKWCLCGGEINQGETAVQAAVREVYEESGVVAFAVSNRYLTHPYNLCCGYVAMIQVSGQIKPNKEFSEIKYFDCDKLPSSTMACDIDIIKQIKPK